MKRLNIITRPTTMDSLDEIDSDDNYANLWQLKAERLEARRTHRFRRQLA